MSTNSQLVGKFLLGTDGSGYKHLIVENGALKSNLSQKNVNLHMDGSKIFMFTLANIPLNIEKLLKISKSKKYKIKKFFFTIVNHLFVNIITFIF